MDRQRTIDALRKLRDAFPRQQVTKDTMLIYLEKLSMYPPDVIDYIVSQAIDTYTFFPSVAELKNLVGKNVVGTSEIAEDEWVKVRKAIKHYGAPRTIWNSQTMKSEPSEQPVFTNPTTQQAVESIGWKGLCLNEETESRKEFIFAFRNLQARNVNVIQTVQPGDTAIPEGFRVGSYGPLGAHAAGITEQQTVHAIPERGAPQSAGPRDS